MRCRGGESGLDSNPKKVEVCGELPKWHRKGGSEFWNMEGGYFQIRPVGAGTDIETFFDMQM